MQRLSPHPTWQQTRVESRITAHCYSRGTGCEQKRIVHRFSKGTEWRQKGLPAAAIEALSRAKGHPTAAEAQQHGGHREIKQGVKKENAIHPKEF
jgi:hypothetical protein